MIEGSAPHPVPLPMGEGTPARPVAISSPLPGGEGQGEGRERSSLRQSWLGAGTRSSHRLRKTAKLAADHSGRTMHRLIEGALRFQAETHGLLRNGGGHSGRQTPFAVFVACSDSRVVPEVLTQREPGEIFVVRNAGHHPELWPGGGRRLGQHRIRRGGAWYRGPGGLRAHRLRRDESDPARRQARQNAGRGELDQACGGGEGDRRSDAARGRGRAHAPACAGARERALPIRRNLQTHPAVAAKIGGLVRLYGWVYSVETGSVETYDAGTGRFVPLTLGQPVHATPKPGLAYTALQG